MPTTAYQVFDIQGNRLDPAFDPEHAHMLPVNLKASTTFRPGEPLAETATPGTFEPFVSGTTGACKGILRYGCVTDASGNITLGGVGAVAEVPYIQKDAEMWVTGIFSCAGVPGLATAVLTDLKGHLLFGTVSAGLFKF
jgi:hypothetical protein